MKKKSIVYSDLSKKQLNFLKESYIQKKVESMSFKELQSFVFEVISHQVTDTIDKEEEMEAWKEMSDFFGEEFEIVILEIMQQHQDDSNLQNTELDLQKQRLELLEKNSINKEKEDMWND